MEADIFEYESRFWGWNKDENTYPYPTFPDIESAIKAFAVGKDNITEEEKLQKWASQEFCSNETELLSSKTVSRIIKIAETEKLSRDIQTLTLDKPEKIATSPSILSEALKLWKKPAKMDSYDRFINGEPISKNERDYLITLFKNPEIREIILDTLSKIDILYWEKNKNFIKKFLENEKWEYDISNPLRCVLHNLENYPFVLDFSFDEIAPIKHKVTYPVWWQYFEYKKWDKSGFILKLEDKLYYLTTLFDKIDILSNWLIFWSVNTWEKTKWAFSTDTMLELSSEYIKIWEFYQFNWAWFDFVYWEKWIKNVYESSEWLIIKWENNKYWLLGVSQIEKDILNEVLLDKWEDIEESPVDNWIKEFKIEKILDNRFDQLNVKNWLIIGFNEDEDRGFWKVEIFKNTKVDFTKSPIQIKDYVLKLLDLDNVTFHSHFKHLDIQFYDNWKLLCIQTLFWNNFYSFDEERNQLIQIQWLQWINIEQYHIESRLLAWIPVLIRDKEDIQYIVIFDKTTWNVSKKVKWLAKFGYLSNQMHSLRLGFVILESKKEKYIMYIDWTVYCLNPWFKINYIDWMSYFSLKKWFFSKKITIHSKEELEKYADLVLPENLPVEIK